MFKLRACGLLEHVMSVCYAVDNELLNFSLQFEIDVILNPTLFVTEFVTILHMTYCLVLC
jgi:hypothetical protein